MEIPQIHISAEEALELETFKELDYYSVQNYNLPIELMMENAGLNLARVVASHSGENKSVSIGVGPGNNGGGGLVAARRLAAWGYQVGLDIPDQNLRSLPAVQLERALAFGVRPDTSSKTSVWVDAYFGFAQRHPLPNEFQDRIKQLNDFEGLVISLDLPTGISAKSPNTMIQADIICTLAAPKRILAGPNIRSRVLILDLGIPKSAFEDLGLKLSLPFDKSPILEWVRD